MECSSIVSIAAFNPKDPGSNPGWFAVSNSNRKLNFMNYASLWYSGKYCNPVMGSTLIVGDK